MVLDATTTRASRRGLLTLIAAVAVLVAMLSMFAPATARAAEPRNAALTTAGWTPNLTPLGNGEQVNRNVSSAERAYKLQHCPAGYLCVAAGQGDGLHTVWELWYCTERSLSNFIDAGAVSNNQSDLANALLLDQNHFLVDWVAPGYWKDVDWGPVWYLKPC